MKRLKSPFRDANNHYLFNGHNTSKRDDLKIYLLENGAYLLFYQALAKRKDDVDER